MSDEDNSVEKSSAAARMTRRGVLYAGAAIGAAATSTAAHAMTAANGHPVFGNQAKRKTASHNLRVQASQSYVSYGYAPSQTNGDEGRYSDYRGSYSKGLPHNDLGEVDPSAYGKYLFALETGNPADFEAIPLGGSAKLANPQAAYRFELTGADGNLTRIRPAPAFASAETAAETGEVYWRALCRDVPFTDYNSNMLIGAAVSDLNGFSGAVGPKSGGAITRDTLFRGGADGCLTGPYISQFLWRDVPYGNGRITQRYATPTPGVNYMTTYASWLATQRGQGGGPTAKSGSHYIFDGRSLGEWVHVDFTYQAFINAALILLGIGAFDSSNPYASSANQGAFITFGGGDVLHLVAKAGDLALTGAWYQKWLVNRRQRPEVTGGRVHNTKTGAKTYDLHQDLLDSDAVSRVYNQYGTYLLPMAFAEGSPTHPSYPAGHAAISGACVTVLKAFFNEDALVPNPVVANADGSALGNYGGALTIGGELNKLAYNVALGRDFGGVHYRSEGDEGISVGEQQAIGLLKDYSRTYNESFSGFTLTKFDGQKIRIANGVALAI